MDHKLYTKGKPLDNEIMDTIVKAYPDTYKDVELGMLLYGYALRRKEKKLPVTVEYITWLRSEMLEMLKK